MGAMPGGSFRQRPLHIKPRTLASRQDAFVRGFFCALALALSAVVAALAAVSGGRRGVVPVRAAGS